MNPVRTLFAALAFSGACAGLMLAPAYAQSGQPGQPAQPAGNPAGNPTGNQGHPATGQGLPAHPPAPPAAPPPPAAVRYDSADVQVRGVAAIVRIIPQHRSDIAVAIFNPGPLPAPEARRRGARLVIDGGLNRKINRCRGERTDFAVHVDGHGWVGAAQMPMIELYVPEHVSFAGEGAMRLSVGPADSANIALHGMCGEADFESVRERGEFNIAGGGRLRVFDVGSLSLTVAGGGDVVLGVVRNGLELSLAGGGDVNAARVDGPTSLALQGGGDVTIRAGYANPLSIVMAGGGDVSHMGRATNLDAVLLGGGDVHVREVEGQVTRRVLGGGDITVGR